MTLQPIEQTNAKEVSNIRPVEFDKLTFPYIKALASEVVDGPESILVRRRAGDMERDFPRIFRIVTRVPNMRRESWAVFSRRNETGGGTHACVLRHSVWDMAADIAAHHLRRWSRPETVTAAWYVPAPATASLWQTLANLDERVQSGIVLRPRASAPVPAWQEVCLSRVTDLSEVELSWFVQLELHQCEGPAFTVAAEIQRVIDIEMRSDRTIESMRMKYAWTPYIEFDMRVPGTRSDLR